MIVRPNVVRPARFSIAASESAKRNRKARKATNKGTKQLESGQNVGKTECILEIPSSVGLEGISAPNDVSLIQASAKRSFVIPKG